MNNEFDWADIGSVDYKMVMSSRALNMFRHCRFWFRFRRLCEKLC